MKKLVPLLAILTVLLIALTITGVFAAVTAFVFWREADSGPAKNQSHAVKNPMADLRGPAKGLRVLFVGNSHVTTHDLPELVTKLAAAGNVDRPLMACSQAPGGTSFKMHWEQGQVQRLLDEVKWDLVVLQDQSAMPNFSRAERNRETLPYARKLDEKIKASGARTVLFMTWGYKDFFVPMQKQAQVAYQELADDLKADLVPVGAAWERAQQARPNLDLWSVDGNHADLKGAYLSACVFYTAFYGQSPVGNSFTAGLADADARFLQETAANVVPLHPGGFAAKAPGRAQ